MELFQALIDSYNNLFYCYLELNVLIGSNSKRSRMLDKVSVTYIIFNGGCFQEAF